MATWFQHTMGLRPVVAAFIAVAALNSCGADTTPAASVSRSDLTEKLTEGGLSATQADCVADRHRDDFPLDGNSTAIVTELFGDMLECEGIEHSLALCVGSTMAEVVSQPATLDHVLSGTASFDDRGRRAYVKSTLTCRGMDDAAAECVVEGLGPEMIRKGLAPGPSPADYKARLKELGKLCR